MASVVKRLLGAREFGVFIALIALVLVVSILRYPAFLTGTNLFNVSRQIAFTAIVAIGVLFVILTGGVDLSLGSTVGLTGFLCGVALAMWQAPPLLAVIIGVATGAAVGAFNGAIVAYVGVTSFIVTLGMLTAGRSIIYMFTNGANITDVPDVFSTVGNGSVGPLPVPVVVLLVVAVACHIVLTYTTFGRRIYAIGGNEEATHLSGINVKAVKFFAYVVCSSLCAITGLLYVGRFRSAVANGGVGLELDAIAAAVIGGTSLMGGTGSVLGVVIGACIMGVVSNAITLLEIKSEAQGMIIGGIIIAAAILDVLRTRKTSLTPAAFVFVMGLVSALMLACDGLFIDAHVRAIYFPVVPWIMTWLLLAAAILALTMRPWWRGYLAFMQLRPTVHTLVIAVVAAAFLIYLFAVNIAWGTHLVAAAVVIYLVLTTLMALVKGQRSSPAMLRRSSLFLALAGAVVCLYFMLVLLQDFANDRTILNTQRLSTLLILGTIGATGALVYAAMQPLRTARHDAVREAS